MDDNPCMIILSQLHFTMPVAPWFIDAAAGFIGLLVAVAAIWLQWKHFKKTHPVEQNVKSIRAPFGQASNYSRWKNLYWREVRATFALALISLFMVGGVVLLRGEVTIASIASVVFWIGMFFYNLWVAQWYAWRLSTKRKR
jgi:hypothetical protein